MKTLTAVFWSVVWFGILLAVFVFLTRFIRRAGGGSIVGRFGGAVQAATDTSR